MKMARPSRKITPADVASVGEPLFYTIRQAAATLGCSYRTVEQMVRDGRLFSVKNGGRRLIPAWAATAYAHDLCASQDYDGRYAAYTAEYGLSA